MERPRSIKRENRIHQNMSTYTSFLNIFNFLEPSFGLLISFSTSRHFSHRQLFSVLIGMGSSRDVFSLSTFLGMRSLSLHFCHSVSFFSLSPWSLYPWSLSAWSLSPRSLSPWYPIISLSSHSPWSLSPWSFSVSLIQFLLYLSRFLYLGFVSLSLWYDMVFFICFLLAPSPSTQLFLDLMELNQLTVSLSPHALHIFIQVWYDYNIFHVFLVPLSNLSTTLKVV